MSQATPELSRDIDSPHAVITAQAAELAAARKGLKAKALEIEKLKIQLARLRRMKFGRSSEKIEREIEQLELLLEDLETSSPDADLSGDEDEESAEVEGEGRSRKPRRKLPDHLARCEERHDPNTACPECGGAMRQVGEDVSEVLDYVPGRFRVIRHVRPALSCRSCETMVQESMPSLPIERGMASAALYVPRSDQQILRPPALVPAKPDLCPRRCRSSPHGAGRLGRQMCRTGPPPGRYHRRSCTVGCLYPR